jgi:NADH-quinone oxidoreductase subunit G
MEGAGSDKLQVCVCVGTSCYVRGSQKLLERIMQHVKEERLDNTVDVRATFCFEACDKGPTVRIGETVIHKCTFDDVKREIRKQAAVVR